MEKNKNFEVLSSNTGITLIALVITIIVLLILAGVTIQTLTGDNGLLTKAANAKEASIIGEEKEKIRLGYIEYQMHVRNSETRDLKVEGATVTKNNSNWEIQFNETQHQYTLLENGTIIEGIENNQEQGSGQGSGNNQEQGSGQGSVNTQEKTSVETENLEVTFNSSEAQNVQIEFSDISDNEEMTELCQEIAAAAQGEDCLEFLPDYVRDNIPYGLSNVSEVYVLSMSNYSHDYGNGQFVIRYETPFSEGEEFVTLLIIKNYEDEYEYFIIDTVADSEGRNILEIPSNILEKMNGNPTAVMPII